MLHSKAEATLNDIVPGVTVRGEDIGRWLATQRRDWKQLGDEQQTRLAQLGVTPAAEPAAPARPRRASGSAFGVRRSSGASTPSPSTRPAMDVLSSPARTPRSCRTEPRCGLGYGCPTPAPAVMN